MTTHDQQPAADSAAIVEPEFSNARTEVPVSQSESPVPNEPDPTETVPESAEVQPSDDELLFTADTSGLRTRWDEIQTAFVDDPADCVQKADALVTEVVEQLTTAFSEARSRLEAQWARGETASTEELRLALTRYREFFQRLLTV